MGVTGAGGVAALSPVGREHRTGRGLVLGMESVLEREKRREDARRGPVHHGVQGATQDSKQCNLKPCDPVPATKGCKNIKVPTGFFGFNGKPVKNIADCTWDYFSCTNSYGAWPGNKACCDERFSQCCMQVMTWTPTTQRPSAGYGPAEIDIDIETDLDLPTLENPIDDIDLAGGQSVHRP